MAKPYAENLFEAEEGCHSVNWHLEEGLSDADKKRLAPGMAEACQLMQEDGLTFDEARFQMVARQMELMGVDPTGMPLDPKAFTFEKGREERPIPPKLSQDGWGSVPRSTGSRRGYQTVHTPTGELPMPRLPVDLPRLPTDSARKSVSASLWMAGYKVIKPMLRGPMFVRAMLFFILAVLILLLRLIQGSREPILPSMLFEPAAASLDAP
ncbi:UPF0357 protein YCL012C [Durusdinium trenchii]|uniref:UPF0357 protein YCL012C n=1 Tax=Durusdinium trenchii TaxID=1381693 RepID=A0ABP0HMB8_9DINO